MHSTVSQNCLDLGLVALLKLDDGPGRKCGEHLVGVLTEVHEFRNAKGRMDDGWMGSCSELYRLTVLVGPSLTTNTIHLEEQSERAALV